MYIDKFCEYLDLERNYSDRTIQSYRKDLELFESFFLGIDRQLDFCTIDRDIVRSWTAGMIENGCTPSTVNRKLSTLRSFYKFMCARGYTVSSPAYGLKGPKGSKPLPRFVRESEMDRLLDETDLGSGFAGALNRAVITVLYETGMRLAELVGLNDSDISFDTHTIKVLGKRDKQRIIPFGDELENVLGTYLQERGSVIRNCPDAFFINQKGNRIQRHQVYKIVRDSLSLVSVPGKKSPHVLRHTFATTMLNHDAGLGVVKELLGHESLATTQIYTHTTSEELKRIYRQAHPRT